MLGWIFRIVLLGLLAWGVLLGYRMVERERPCYWANRCEDRVAALWVHLEFYSVDRVLDLEKESGRPSPRRTFYPARLEDLVAGKDAREGIESAYRCPIFGLPYRYTQLDGGKSYFACCPAQHRFHQGEQPFVNAIMPHRRDLALFVQGGKVFNVKASHPNPWDFGMPRLGFTTPEFQVEAVEDLPASLVEMVKENPTPVATW